MTDHDTHVRTEFSRQAEAMSKATIFNDETVLARIRDAVLLSPDTHALDIACGPGIIAEALARGAREVVGCDITPRMLEMARERCARAGLSNVRFVPGRAEALPFEDGEFDAVVSRSAVHHFTDPVAAFREMTRVVRKGGRVVTVDVMSSESPHEAQLHNALETIRDPSHVRMLPKAELHSALAAAGLAIESCNVWINRREYEEWMKIMGAPERIAPLKVVMTALARGSIRAGIGLRIEDDRIRFEHTAGLTVAIRSRGSGLYLIDENYKVKA